MLLIQKLWARLQTLWCKHDWRRVPHHFTPGEPWFMRCTECLRMTKLDTYLTDKEDTPNGN